MSSSRPNGLAIRAVARLTDEAKNGDLQFSSRKVIVHHPTEAPQEFEVEKTFGADLSDRALFEGSVNSCVTQFLNGRNACVVAVGGHGSKKTGVLETQVPMAIEAIFQKLKEQSKQQGRGRGRGHGGGGGHSWSMTCTFYEIYDEIIQDLLDADNRDLGVEEDDEVGVTVRGVTRRSLADSEEAQEAFAEGRDSRNNQISDFGPCNKFTSAVFRLDLEQRTTTGDAGPTMWRTQFLFVDVAAIDDLTSKQNEIQALRMKQGPTLSKAILALNAVSTTLAQSRSADAIVRYTDSKLTHLLSDALGGNFVTVCLVVLRSGMAAASRKALRLASKLRETENYPVEMEDKAQGLLRRFRQRIGQLADEVAIAGGGFGGGAGGGGGGTGELQDMARKCSELEGKAIKDELRHLQMRDKYNRTYEKLVELQTKFKKLVETRGNDQKSMIASEEERLRISRALLDLQIENNSLVERSESEKYELVTKLLNAENDILELEMKEQKKGEKKMEMKERVEALMREKKEIGMEYTALRNNFTNLNQDFKAEKRKNEELGVELINIVNEQKTRKKELEEKRRLCENQEDELKGLQRVQATHNVEMDDLRSKLAGERELVEALRTKKVSAELQLKETTINFETKKLGLERSSAEYTRDRENEMITIKKSMEAEQKRFEAEKESLSAKIKQLEGTVRQRNRVISTLEGTLSGKLQEEAKLTDEKEKLLAKIGQLTENYRAKLMEYINDEAGDEEDEARLREELIGTFRKKEVDLEHEIEEYRNRNHDLVRKNRGIYAKYRDLKHRLEDLDPTSVTTEETNLVKGLRSESSDVEAKMERELTVLREKKRHLEGELQSAQAKSVQSAEQYRRRAREFETKSAEMATNIKLLEKEKQHLQDEVERGLSNASGGGGMDPRAVKQLQEMQQNMMAQIKEMKVNSGPSDAEAGLKDELRRLRADLREAKANAGSGRRSSNRAAAPDPGIAMDLKRLKADNASLREQVEAGPKSLPEFKNAGEAIKRAAELMTRNAVVEEQLKTYQEYMKNTLKKFRAQADELKTELKFWKQKATEKGVSAGAYRG